MIEKNQYLPGKHVLLDFFGAKHLTDVVYIENALRKAARACNATILEITLHSFGEGDGVTGVALLTESHISIHSWPETDFVALDIFVCGDCDASLAIAPLKAMFSPTHTNIREIMRGTEYS
jgi:S-adenosylmethionine decarboxylase